LNKPLFVTALLLIATLAIPLVTADDEIPPVAGVTPYPYCVWWNTAGRDVYTPGTYVDVPPVHLTIDPVYVATLPPTSGEVCVGSIIPLPELP